MGLTPEQVQIIKSTVPILREHGLTITTRFYEDMLAAHKELNNVFNHTNQINGQQARALADSLYAYASYIDDLGVLAPAVERISQKHASLYVRPEQYDIVGFYLLKAMKDVLGAALTEPVQTAWATAYKQLADLMIGREGQIYSETDGWDDWRDFEIVDKIQESEEITSFLLKPKDGKPLPSYQPGQYISIRTEVPDLKHLQSRQYSLSDAPRTGHYRISVKREQGLDLAHPDAIAHPGYISNTLHNEKQVGDALQVSHPAGEFFLDAAHDQRPLVLMSAGVGLTPMMSIMKTLAERNATQAISWIHGTRNSKVQAFGKDVLDMAAHHQNIHLSLFLGHPDEKDMIGKDYNFAGRMSLEKLDKKRDLLLDKNDAVYYICGPEGFMSDMRASLKALRVGEERIKLELFGTGSLPEPRL